MLHILHAEDAPSPTQAYAHRCWQENPHIAPSWWREMHGHTVSKIAHDARLAPPSSPLPQGLNLFLTSPATHPATQTLLAQTETPAAYLTSLCTPTPAATPAQFIIWEVPATLTDAEALATLTALEKSAATGPLEAYGLSDPDLAAPDTPRPLHRWLELATEAASAVHGRRKRPALRLLHLNFDLLNLSALTSANTHHKNQPVSPLELASRLGLAVIATPLALPEEETPPSPEALATLTAFAQAEAALHQTLGGWPAVEGAPLFSVLARLSAQQPPWPTPHHWLHWQRHLWPLMESFLATHPSSAAEILRHSAQNLFPHGLSLAQFAARKPLSTLLSQLNRHLSPEAAALPAQTRQSFLLSSIPGLAALAVSPVRNLQLLQKMGDFPDVGILFHSSPHST